MATLTKKMLQKYLEAGLDTEGNWNVIDASPVSAKFNSKVEVKHACNGYSSIIRSTWKMVPYDEVVTKVDYALRTTTKNYSPAIGAALGTGAVLDNVTKSDTSIELLAAIELTLVKLVNWDPANLDKPSNYVCKKVEFWMLDTSAGKSSQSDVAHHDMYCWFARKSLDKDTEQLAFKSTTTKTTKQETPEKTKKSSAKGHGKWTPKTITSEDYMEDDVDVEDYMTDEDDTDNSVKDLPRGIHSNKLNSFVKATNDKLPPNKIEGIEEPDRTAYSDSSSSFAKEQNGINQTTNEKGKSTNGANISSLDDFKHLVRSRGIWTDDVHKWNYQYNRMQWSNPDYAVGPTREFLFFTKPDLHVLKRGKNELNGQLSNDPFWQEMFQRYRGVMQMLQYSAAPPKSGNTEEKSEAIEIAKNEFIPMLTNAVSGSLDLPGSSAETTETASTIYGTTIQYRKGAWKSDEGFDFGIEMVDSPALSVYHFFKMWEEYTKLKDCGLITPPGPKNCNPYRLNKILHDQIGIFKFILDDDMETILYYAYLTGCFPKSVPRDSFGNINPGMISYSIDWHAQFVEDMNPLILIHFNNIMRKQIAYSKKESIANTMTSEYNKVIDSSIFKYVPIYNYKKGHVNGGFRLHPVIGIVKTPKHPGTFRYVLRWYDMKDA